MRVVSRRNVLLPFSALDTGTKTQVYSYQDAVFVCSAETEGTKVYMKKMTKRFTAAVLTLIILISSVGCFTVSASSAQSDDYIAGDINGDGNINMLDIIMLRRYLLNSAENPADNELAADTNGDTAVNMLDVILLRRHLLNGEEFPLAGKVPSLEELSPADVGTNFTAQLTNVGAQLNLSLSDLDVIIYPSSTAAAQKYIFSRQEDGSYMLINTKNYYILTAEDSAPGSNVLLAADTSSASQRWYIYSTDKGYILSPVSSDECVLMPAGGATASLTSVGISTYTGDSTQYFNFVKETSYLTDYQMEVMRNIIYAVETGGQVYGRAVYDCLIEAYTNSSIEYAITIGAGQWYATEAKRLLNMIRAMYPSVYEMYDADGALRYDLDNADWSVYDISASSEMALRIKSIIGTEGGIKCQDILVDLQMRDFVAEAAELGVTDVKALMMCANIRHQGGLGAVKRVLGKVSGEYTLDNIYEAMQTDTGNQVGTYKSRQKFVYNTLNSYVG